MRKWRYITGVGVVSASLLVVLTLSDNAQTGAPVHPSAWNKVHRSISRVLPWRSAVSHYFVEAGREMLIRSDLPSAEMYFYRALKVRRDSMDALEGLLIVKQQQGDFTGARETANQLAEIAPRHPKVMATRGYQLATEGKVEEAIAAYRRAGRLSDWDQDILVRNLRHLVREQQFDRAERLSQEASQLFPLETVFCNNLAWWYQEEGVRLDTALEQARQALRIEPGAAHVWDTLAWVQFRRGQKAESVRAARKAIALGAVSESRILLAIIYLKEANVREAAGYLQPPGLLRETDGSVRKLLREEITRVLPRVRGKEKEQIKVFMESATSQRNVPDSPPHGGNRARTLKTAP